MFGETEGEVSVAIDKLNNTVASMLKKVEYFKGVLRLTENVVEEREDNVNKVGKLEERTEKVENKLFNSDGFQPFRNGSKVVASRS